MYNDVKHSFVFSVFLQEIKDIGPQAMVRE